MRFRATDAAAFFGVATCFFVGVQSVLQLPNTGGIDGQLTANHSVDHFFTLWLVFNNDGAKISDKPFTIFTPKNSPSYRAENVLQQPELVKKLLLDHVVLGTKINLSSIVQNITLFTLGGRAVTLKVDEKKRTKANNVTVLESIEVPNGILVIVENYLFPDSNSASAKPTPTSIILDSRLMTKGHSNTSFVKDVLEVLSFLKSRVRVFQHFLSRSNVSQLLKEGEEYTVFVPTDHAFQRWHPIDWGFYPFSVPEFTESVIVNHFVRGRLKQDTIKDGQVVQTLGGKEILFKRTPSLTVNGAAVVKGDTPVEKGNIMFIGEVLFVSESVVSKLHQQHKDKETPPLLAFPWFGAQFLSHAFLALERDKRFAHITRFLNLADLAPHVSGAGYTFFVPTDTAFEELGLDKMPDNYLSNGEGLQILLNHFVKGRLYDKDLKNGTVLTTLGNETLIVNRTKENVHINEALIVESEVFVYNLGTMFYIDKVLYNTIKVPPVPIGGNIPKIATTSTTSIPNTTSPTQAATNFTTTLASTSVNATTKPSVTSPTVDTVEATSNTEAETTVNDVENATGELSEEHDPEVVLGDGTQKPDGETEFTTVGRVQNVSLPK